MVETPRPEVLEALRAAKRIYRKNRTLTLVSHADADVWANKVFFAEQDGYLYGVIEQPRNGRGHHYRNIVRNPHVFFLIDRGVPDLFLQGEGQAEILGDVTERPERHILFRRVPEAVIFAKFFPLLVFRIRPTHLYISDYSEEWKPRARVEVSEDLFRLFQGPLKSSPRPWQAYWQAVRSFSFTVTIFAILLGALLAPVVSWPLLLLALVGGLLAHAGTNVISDYFDHRRGVDTWLTLGSSRVLLDELMQPRRLIAFGFLLLVLAAAVGVTLALLRGLPVLYLALAGGFLAAFYTSPPVGFKYRALGDAGVFLAFGPLMALGSYYVQAQAWAWTPVLLSVPLGLLTVAILHGNNLRDMADDARLGFKTVAALLGFRGSGIYYASLVAGAYAFTVLAVALGRLSPWGLLVFLTAPLAWRNLDAAFHPRRVDFTFLDLVTARLHFRFGLLLVGAVALGRFLPVVP